VKNGKFCIGFKLNCKTTIEAILTNVTKCSLAAKFISAEKREIANKIGY